MAHDSDYYRRRTAQAGSAVARWDEAESVEVAGHLALAYAAIARRKAAAAAADVPGAVDPLLASVADEVPLLLRD